MRIKRVHIKNFRTFSDQAIEVDPYTCLVGPNGAGKSTVLSALNIFFREPSNATAVDVLTEEDFHQRNIAERIEITVTFHELSAQANEQLQDYVRGHELIVSAVAQWDEAKKCAPVQQVGSRMGVAAFAPFFEAYKGAPAAEVQRIFEELSAQFPGIQTAGARSKDAKRDALHAFEASPENIGLLTPIESEDQFYGIAGNSKLRPYIQWVYVPAVKDASDEQAESKDGALGKLLARTVRGQVNFKEQLGEIERKAQTEFQELLNANQGVLDRVAESLSARLSQWSHPDVALKLNWNSNPISIKEPAAKVLAGEAGFEGSLTRFGHGFQRSYLLALLQELATSDVEDAPTLALGIEEPELYQHPPQARYLSQVLQTLADQNAQVVITTHSPYFIVGSAFQNIRMVRKDAYAASSTVHATTHADFAERYAEADEERPKAPGAIEVEINEILRAHLNEMFFATKIIFVEGTEDVAYLMAWMALKERLGEFRSQGAHVVAVEGKSNLARPLIIAQALQIPVFVVFDGDRASRADGRHVADNRRLLRLLGAPETPLFPDEINWGASFVQWPDEFSDQVIAELRGSIGEAAFNQITEQARVACGLAGKLDKNTMFIQRKLQLAHAAGARCPTLDTLCDRILAAL